MAPPIADLIDGEFAAGTLVLREGHLAGVTAGRDGAQVRLRTPAGLESFETARVINCTGPSMNYRRVDSPLLRSLFTQGLATAGPLGGGLDTTRCGSVLSASGQASSIIFNVGPGRLGTLLESIAIPEIREQAVEIATVLAERVETMQQAPLPRTVPDRRATLSVMAAA